MNSPVPVCILTAGQGSRMGPLASIINKCLLPYKGKALISHIIASFPKSTLFIIALGYKGEQVREYLRITHSDIHFNFIEVDRYQGPNTGPGYSLLCCRQMLEKPFYFVSCDTLFELDLPEKPTFNWVGISKIPEQLQIDYCNLLVDETQVIEILDKQTTNTASFAFTGLMYINDYKLFWSALENSETLMGEHQISSGLLGLLAYKKLQYRMVNWLDLGTYKKYQVAVQATAEYDFSKTNEFLYFINNQVVKFFNDETIVSQRVTKAALKPGVFPLIKHVENQWYSYDFVPGQTLYAENNPMLFNKLLGWLNDNLWAPIDIKADRMQSLCRSFYKDKTIGRLSDYDKKYDHSSHCDFVNGHPVESIINLMNDMPWHSVFLGVPTFIHGDLQFDNILFDKTSNKFILLDWRQDFSGEVAFGDIYYDLAKLMGGIIINYDYIKMGLFDVLEEENKLFVDFAQRFNRVYYLSSLRSFIENKKLDYKRVQLLVGLIYLNMSSLHHPPFDRALHALGRLILTDVLYANSKSFIFTDTPPNLLAPCY